MKANLDLTARVFLRCKYLFGIFLSFVLLWCVYLILAAFSEPNFDSFANLLVSFISVLIGIFLFVGYELTIRTRDVLLWETLTTYPNCTWQLFFSQLLFGGILAVGFGLLCEIFIVVIWFLIGVGYAPLLLHTILLGVLYCLFVPLVSLLIGQMLAAVCHQRRFSVYLLAIFMILASTSIPEKLASIPESVPLSTLLFNITDFFNFGPKAVSMVMDRMYGIPMEAYKWCTVIFWGVFAFLVSYLVIRRKQAKRWFAGLTAAVCLLLVIGAVSRGSVMTMDGRPFSNSYDNEYYFLQEPVTLNDPGFRITAYDMNIKIWNQISATVTMDVNGLPKEYDGYSFTLYHRMKVTKVINEKGRSLPFEREGDRLWVPVNSGDATRLTVVYHGYSPQHYSNAQCVYLPGNFPYYPMEGNKKVGDNNGMDTAVSDTLKNFSVKVWSPLNLLCNLSGKSNSFSGTAKSLTLIGGMVEELDANRHVYGSPLSGSFNVQASINAFRESIANVNEVLNDRLSFPNVLDDNIFYLPPKTLMLGASDDLLLLEDHIITRNLTDPSQMLRSLLIQKIPYSYNKADLRNYLVDILSNLDKDETHNSFHGSINGDIADWIKMVDEMVEDEMGLSFADYKALGSITSSLVFNRSDGKEYLLRIYDEVVKDSPEPSRVFIKRLLVEVLEDDTNS